ncbi:type 2 DNA topoisomerase 6 subunit B-like isoform X2 [Telopea speciosissima]|uniref:type 2 DNA topoisomerase 6 subunit B-like isoform X2 n=1 Tax=Telopea speciosissima TaxID=54955 RepID=UPI001CC4AE63|nr:type 2 DNA topoisomerase 6 subunit B-like isoform X2 [Telopea speciosissima]
MEVSNTQSLYQNLISSAIQRCRIAEDLCRLTVVLKRIPDSDPPLVRISYTGIGSCLEEFQNLKCPRNSVSDDNFDGVLSVTTTSTCDCKIFHYHINLKETVAARKLTRLPSTPKNGAKFSGTEVSLSTCESIEELIEGITHFFQKMLILKIPKVAVELVVERANGHGSGYENLLLADEGILLSLPISNVERLTSGLEDYVLKHGNMFDQQCSSCFLSREHLKVGNGVGCRTESARSTGQVVEAVIIISELPEPSSDSSPSCFRACSARTEVLYFQEFSPCSIPQSSLDGLTSIDWKSYGLDLGTNVLDSNGCAILEWENLPPYTHIDIVIHCYHKKVTIIQAQQKTKGYKHLVKKAIKVALDGLKQRYKGTLLSAHAVKICSYAPDLARTITGLILSSNDREFQKECCSLLGLQPNVIEEEKKVEDCIKEKIIAIIEINDKKQQRRTEFAPLLFDGENIHGPEFLDEYHEGEDGYSILDL